MRDHLNRPLTEAIVAAINAAGLLAEAGQAPAGAGWQGSAAASTFVPYVAVYPMSGSLDGAIDYGQEDATKFVQLTCVGATVAQAEWASDVARVALLSTAPTVTGRSVALVVIDQLGSCTRDDAIQPPLWYVADRYSVTTTPA